MGQIVANASVQPLMVRVICIMLLAIPVEVVWVAVGPCFDDPVADTPRI